MIRIIYLLLAITTIVLNQAHAEELNLTEEEKVWLAQAPTIRFANEDDWPPFDYSENGEPKGLVTEYVKLIAQKLDIEIEFINGYSWNELYGLGLKRQIDVFPTIWQTKEREEYFTFSEPYLKIPQVIITQQSNLTITNLQGLSEKRVALVKGYAMTDAFIEQVPSAIPLMVNSPLEGLLMLSIGKVDAYIDSVSLLSYNIRKHEIPNLKIASEFNDKRFSKYSQFHFGTRNDWPLLASAIQKAINSITPTEEAQIRGKWLVSIPSNFAEEFKISEIESSWLASMGTLDVGVHPDWAPIEFLDAQQKIQGISSEYIKELEQAMKVKTRLVEFDDPSEIASQVNKGSVDIYTSLIRTQEREKYLSFSEPYMEIPISVFTDEESGVIPNMNFLEQKKVAVIKGSEVEQVVRQRWPFIKVKHYKNLDAAISALQNKKVYALINDLYSTTYYIRKNSIQDIHVANDTKTRLEVCFAVRKDWPEMLILMNRFSKSFNPIDRSSMEYKWLNFHVQDSSPWKNYWKEISLLVSVLLFIILFISSWNHRLAKEIKERKQIQASLEEARQAAEKSAQAKSDFLAVMSHEIRTPLNGVLGMAQLMATTKLTSQQKECLDNISISGKTLLSIVNDILDFSEIEAGKLSLDKHVFEVRKAINEAVHFHRVSALEKGLEFNLSISDNVPEYIFGDSEKIKQILHNLLNNAVKFTSKGEVYMEVDYRTGNDKEKVLNLKIKDDGIGLSEEEQKNLFSKFSQADSSTKRRYGGTGLGLAITKSLVTLMKGQISLESTKEVGTTFYVELPLKKESPTLQLKKTQFVNSATEKISLKVLIVEDNEINQIVLHRLLNKLNCEVNLATNGEEALQICESESFDVIFMDLQMPKMDGYETTAQLRKQKNTNEVPIIALTANVMEEDKIKCLQSGMNMYMSKPIQAKEIEKLLAKIRKGKEI
ncbi:MAG: transporter substrate-binding domain-containing protein [Lentisphaeria bacterium]|nr:transporter substrate-binding domain-containing protein [Lentisphaeria bacterium]